MVPRLPTGNTRSLEKRRNIINYEVNFSVRYMLRKKSIHKIDDAPFYIDTLTGGRI